MPCDITGSGAPLLLIHGITESRRTWDPLVPALAQHHTVVAVDLPGHGEAGPAASYDVESMAGAVARDVEAAGVGPPVVVGHSLGGVVATALAAFHPCRGVINVDQPLELAGFKDLLHQIEPGLRGDEAGFQATMRMVLDSLFGALPAGERARVEALQRPRQDVVLGIWSQVLEQPVEEIDGLIRTTAAAVSVPYLAIHGSDTDPAYADWLAGVIRGARVEVWPGLGHYPHLVEPERFLARLDAFEQELAPA